MICERMRMSEWITLGSIVVACGPQTAHHVVHDPGVSLRQLNAPCVHSRCAHLVNMTVTVTVIEAAQDDW
jgi:hypothetical protein